jgi:Fur family transcriptional regulator, ferric uptake regulator
MSPALESLQSFETLLKRKSLKLTRERRAIFDRVVRTRGHFDADSLYDAIAQDADHVARGTVYRTIPLLLESGVIQKSVGSGHRDFYEANSGKPHHDHMVCIQCQKVIEFHCDPIEKMQEEVCEKYGFKLAFHDHRLFGYCRDCNKG